MTSLRDSDYMNHLVNYIEKNLSKGYTADQLKIVLINQGYSRAAIDRAFKLVIARLPPKPAPVPKEQPKIEMPQEEKKPGFFARLFGWGKKKEDKVEIDPLTGYRK